MIRLRFWMPAVLVLVACSRDGASSSGSLPSGVACTTTASASDGSGAAAALASAPAGSCVLLTGAAYAGPFAVPPGVTLVAQDGSRAAITGGRADMPAVTLGEKSALIGIDVPEAGGVAIAVRAATALVSNVTAIGAKNAALAVLCKESATPGCAAGLVTIANVTLAKSSLGLWVSGAHVAMNGGTSSNHGGTSLTASAGVIAQDGARLELDGVTIEKNQGVGVVIDGPKTTASIKNAVVNENGERGIWAQRLEGSLAAPALQVEGTKITKNKIVGIGGVEARGIIIVGGSVVDTVSAPTVTTLQTTEDIGDGIGIFSGSGDVKIDGALIQSNSRAAGVIDRGHGETSIIIVGGTVDPGPSGFKFVVQDSPGVNVQMPDAYRTTPPKVLGVSAPKLTLPNVL